MSLTRYTMVGALALTSLVACSTSFPYRRYSPEFKTFRYNNLLGGLRLLAPQADGSRDRPFSDCIAFDSRGYPRGSYCVVFFTDEYAKMKSDYEEAMRRLKKCGRACY